MSQKKLEIHGKLTQMSRKALWAELGEAIERLRVTYALLPLNPPRSKYQEFSEYSCLLDEVEAIDFHLNWAHDKKESDEA